MTYIVKAFGRYLKDEGLLNYIWTANKNEAQIFETKKAADSIKEFEPSALIIKI